MHKPVADDSRFLGAFAPALVLLAICVMINYVDRGNLSVAAPLLKRELGLSPSQLGILFAAFFITYTAMQFVIGWLIDRFDVNRILAAGFLIWSLATATTGLLRGFALLLAMRLILGVGESVAVPASSKILARHLSEHHRGFASGVVMSALRWISDGKVWLAACLYRDRTAQLIVAAGLDEMDATQSDFRCGCCHAHSRLCRNLQAKILLGHICRAVLLQLSVLFHDYLASHLSCD